MMSSKSSTPLIKRVTPLFSSWIRQNHRLLSSSALREASSLVDDSIHLTDNCIRVLRSFDCVFLWIYILASLFSLLIVNGLCLKNKIKS
ncbi:hypothetical protein OIU78_003270 [Salix suchowensis]|nr:hypothetical protein OIU78_003270 [Salix suchowensis]